jgi:hypothetical protein
MKATTVFLATLTLFLLSHAAPAQATTLPIVSGELTASAILNSSFQFLGIDIRGTVGLATPEGGVLLTDEFASPTFGNTTLVALDPGPFDGTAVEVNFQVSSLEILPGPELSAMTLGTTIAGPSPAEANFLNDVQYTFNLVDTAPYGQTGDIAASFVLGSVSIPSAVPEPAMPVVCAVGMLLFVVARSRNKILGLLKR